MSKFLKALVIGTILFAFISTAGYIGCAPTYTAIGNVGVITDVRSEQPGKSDYRVKFEDKYYGEVGITISAPDGTWTVGDTVGFVSKDQIIKLNKYIHSLRQSLLKQQYESKGSNL